MERQPNMTTIHSKSGLAVALSRLSGFINPKVRDEQYATDSEAAATLLWSAYMKGDLEEKRICDLGSGTGILGLGALLLGASSVTMVERDPEATAIAKKNLAFLKSEGLLIEDGEKAFFAVADIADFTGNPANPFDCVVENPPFGVKNSHADRQFLSTAFSLAPIVWSMHKSESKEFLTLFTSRHHFLIDAVVDISYPLPPTMHYHTKRMLRIPVSLFRFIAAE